MTYLSSLVSRTLRVASALVLLPVALSAQGVTGTLVGRVMSGDVAVPSATVVASNGRVTQTRVDGRYRITLPAGRYEVRARTLGFIAAVDSVTIIPGGTATLDFNLTRSVATLQAVSTLGTRGPWPPPRHPQPAAATVNPLAPRQGSPAAD